MLEAIKIIREEEKVLTNGTFYGDRWKDEKHRKKNDVAAG
jgi:hypothetical protein